LQSRFADFQALDTEIVAVSADPPESLREIVEGYDLAYPLLSDPDLELIDALGLRHPMGDISGGDIARPAVFVVDRDGSIVWRDLTDNWRVRVRPARLLAELARIP
jgi:peroxiredoxin